MTSLQRCCAATPTSLHDPAVLQAFHPLPSFDGMRPVVGSWIVGDRPCGVGIREDATAITGNRSRFVTHAIPLKPVATEKGNYRR